MHFPMLFFLHAIKLLKHQLLPLDSAALSSPLSQFCAVCTDGIVHQGPIVIYFFEANYLPPPQGGTGSLRGGGQKIWCRSPFLPPALSELPIQAPPGGRNNWKIHKSMTMMQ